MRERRESDGIERAREQLFFSFFFVLPGLTSNTLAEEKERKSNDLKKKN